MSPQPNRLPDQAGHFTGAELDRSKPLSFRLDGRLIRGFAGDTILSAVIAAGIIAAGRRDGEPVALDERFAPPVLLRASAPDRRAALPMERTPAIDGLDLVTLARARRGKLGRATGRLWSMARGGAGLELSYDDDMALATPWLDLPSSLEVAADLAVIGGGLAGMSAALAAGRRGQRVVLIERRQSLGGDARFFGSVGDEEAPDTMIGRLATTIAGLPNITVLCRADAFAVFDGAVRVNEVAIENGLPASRTVTIVAPRIVVANGAIERLPVFAGNRRPGVVGAMAAFNRADRFGVWIGRRALLSTSNSVGYRVAMQARNAGVAVERIIDTRLDPQSRFIEFSKAYGIPLARASRPILAEPGPRHLGGLTVRFDASFDGVERASTAFTAQQLLVAGGWQPDLTLWHMAGGASRWDAKSHRLVADGSLNRILLAGAAAGYRNTGACIRSGEAAVAELLGRSVPGIDDTQIDPIHETVDDATPIAAFDAGMEGQTYLDWGTTLTVRPAPRRRRLLSWRSKDALADFAEQARPLSVGDVAAGVQLGVIPADDAPTVAQERCVTPSDIVDAARLRPPVYPVKAFAEAGPPPYLAGRFGSKAAVWLVEADDGRDFEVGCLLYLNSDRLEPILAVGVVFAAAPGGRKGSLALAGSAVTEGSQMVVRDISGPIVVRVSDPATATVPPAALETTSAIGEKPTESTPAVDEATAGEAELAPTPEAGPSLTAGSPAPSPPAETEPARNGGQGDFERTSGQAVIGGSVEEEPQLAALPSSQETTATPPSG